MKLLINKYLVGFLFAFFIILMPVYNASAQYLAIEPDPGAGGGGGAPSTPCLGTDCFGTQKTNFGQTQIENTRSNIFSVTVSLNKSSNNAYAPGEKIDLVAIAAYPTCGNINTGVYVTGQIVDLNTGKTYNSKVIISEHLEGGYAIYGSASFGGSEEFSSFYAPTEPGNYVMRIVAGHQDTLQTRNSLLGTYGFSETFEYKSETFDIPFKIAPDCSLVPSGYTKCSNEGGTCTFPGEANVAFGCSPLLNYKDANASISCDTTTFGGDPVPNMAKSCFFKLKPIVVVPEQPSIRVWTIAPNVDNKPTINNSESTEVHWKAAGLTLPAHCSSPQKPGVLLNYPEGSFETDKLLSDTKFLVTCSEDSGSGTTTSSQDPGGICQGTVAGSVSTDGSPDGPYEGQSCSPFSKAACGTSWVTHGCHWVAN